MARVIVVERPVLSEEQTATLAKCLAVRECVLIQTYRGDAREIAIYDAVSAERVRESHHSSGVPFDRAWAADRLIGDGPQ